MLVDFARRIPSLDRQLRYLWADHGDAVSMHYAGTGALKSGFTRTGKRSLMGFVDDGWKSAVRYYKNNFVDGDRQDMIDIAVGRALSSNGKGQAAGPVYGEGRSPTLLVMAGLSLLTYGLCNGALLSGKLVLSMLSAVWSVAFGRVSVGVDAAVLQAGSVSNEAGVSSLADAVGGVAGEASEG